MDQPCGGAGRRWFAMLAACAVAAVALAATLPALAQPYPAKPVRIVVPFASGGAVDTVGRTVGQKLTEAWKQPVLVDNRPGAGGIIAADHVAKSAADGHTLLLATIALSVTPSLYRKLPYDALRDLVPVTQVTAHALVMTTHPSLAVTSLQDLVGAARAKPGAISYGSTGMGTSGQLLVEWLKLAAGIDMVHVPYKGDAPQVAALVSGEVQLGLVPAIGIVGHVKAGRLRPIAVTGSRRAALFPDIATMAESGISGFEVGSWMGLFAPAGVARETLARIQGEIVKVLALPDIRERFAKQGFEPIGSTPEEFAARFRADFENYAKIAREARIPPLE